MKATKEANGLECTVYQNADSTKDDRHNQRYYRRASVGFLVELDGIEVERELFKYTDHMRKFFGESFSGYTKDSLISQMIARKIVEEKESEDSFFNEIAELGKYKTEPNISTRYQYQYDHEKEDGYIRIGFSWEDHAEKPSLIRSEDEVLADFPDTDRICDWITNAVKESAEELNELHRKLEVLIDTEHLSGWVAKAAREKAEKETRYEDRLESLQKEYEERLKALKAEVKAETYTQGEKIIGDWERHTQEALDAELCEESTEHAPKFWKRFVTEPQGGYKPWLRGGGFSDGPEESKVKPEDIF